MRLPPVAPGRWFLRIDAEGPTTSGRIPYRVTVRRDVPGVLPFVLALVLLLVPPAVVGARSASFEVKRWAESDYAPVSDSSDDDSGADDS